MRSLGCWAHAVCWLVWFLSLPRRLHGTAHCTAQHFALQMLRHLGDFPRRLREHCHQVYEYTPCPPVGYPEIEVRACLSITFVWCAAAVPCTADPPCRAGF